MLGVPVGPKIQSPRSRLPQVNPGQRAIIQVVYQSTGSATVYQAQAILSAVDPFTANDDTSYLGDLAPGQSATARSDVTVDGAAVLKNYGLTPNPVPGRPGQQPDLGYHRGPGPRGPAARDSGNPLEPLHPIPIIVVVGAIALYYLLVYRRKK